MAGKMPEVGVKITAKDAGATTTINRTAAAADGKLSPAFARASRQAQNLTNRIRSARFGLGGLTGMFGGLTGKVSAFLGIGGLLNGAFLGLLGKRSAEAQEKLADLSDQVGVNVEKLQEYSYAAKQSGAEEADVFKALEQLNKRRGDLLAGRGALFSLLKNISPELLKDLRNAEDTGEAFTMIMNAIDKLPDSARKAALSYAAFGRSGQKMIGVSKGGSAELEKLAAAARKYGIITEEDADSARVFGDEIDKLKASAGGLVDRIVADLLPALTPLITDTSEWIAANRELLSLDITNFLKSIGSTAKESWPEIKRIAANFGDLYDAVTELFGLDTPRHMNDINGSVENFKVSRLERIANAFDKIAVGTRAIADTADNLRNLDDWLDMPTYGVEDTVDILPDTTPKGGVKLPEEFLSRKFKKPERPSSQHAALVTDTEASTRPQKIPYRSTQQISYDPETGNKSIEERVFAPNLNTEPISSQAPYSKPQIELTTPQTIIGPTVEKATQQPLNGKITIDLKTDTGSKRIVAPVRNGSVNTSASVKLYDPRYQRNMGGM